MTRNPIACDVPFDTDGKHHGFLRLPYSRDDSAWGSVMIPITVIRNGDGPTALFTGGSHGDEYEGPVAIQNLARELEPDDIRGRVILVPMMNFPAFQAGRRTSPIDGGNLNRLFPGRPDGSVTQKIADYFTRVLVPMADIVLDIHSGGKTLDFLPFAAVHVLEDKDQEAACEAAMRAFNAPYSMKLLEIDSAGMYDDTVEAQGKVFVTTELGGAGTATPASVGIALRGMRNLLSHAGICRTPPEFGQSRGLDMPGPDCFVFARHSGLFEPLVALGDRVEKGATVARVWSADRTGADPVSYTVGREGIIVSRHVPGLIQNGDCLAVVAVDTGPVTGR